MTENKKLIMFDFDGVLVNIHQYCYQIHKINNKDFTWERFQSFSDGNFHDEFQKAVREENFIQIENFYSHYENGLNLVKLEDILHDVILKLADGYILVIVSSTQSNIIKNFLKRENISECFDDVFGHDFHTSKVVKIKSILNKYKLSPSDTVFITDTLGDIKEASECEVPSIAVTWGLHYKDNLEKGGPAAIINDPTELEAEIKNVLK